MKVVFDNNIWISYAIGKSLDNLSEILKRTDIELFVCGELLAEFQNVVQYPKLAKILKPDRIFETFELMNTVAVFIDIEKKQPISKMQKIITCLICPTLYKLIIW